KSSCKIASSSKHCRRQAALSRPRNSWFRSSRHRRFACERQTTLSPDFASEVTSKPPLIGFLRFAEFVLDGTRSQPRAIPDEKYTSDQKHDFPRPNTSARDVTNLQRIQSTISRIQTPSVCAAPAARGAALPQ